jgi:NADH dehydrogenase (ubiquinone) 1 alpha subcomplex subunit 5
LETKIGAGLIEEVIQVAEGELNLVHSMKQSQVCVQYHLWPCEKKSADKDHSWEDLEDKPVEGQWEYFERKNM